MEIKYTIEILTKDIQDIEKLVGNLRNSKDASTIELDLALSKLRNVYEILMLIKKDRLHELAANTPLMEDQAPQPSAEQEVKAEPEPVHEPEAKAEPEPVPEPEAKAEPEPEAKAESEPVPEPETKTEHEPVPEPEATTEPEPVPEADPEAGPSKESPGSSILAEKFSAEASINENLAEKLGSEPDAKLLGQPIDNISRNIGINDRFLIIRELFEGEGERFSSLINELDNAENFETANSILKEHFSDNMDHEGVEILSGLLKRRYIR